jgi:hypothetical protein
VYEREEEGEGEGERERGCQKLLDIYMNESLKH